MNSMNFNFEIENCEWSGEPCKYLRAVFAVNETNYLAEVVPRLFQNYIYLASFK